MPQIAEGTNGTRTRKDGIGGDIGVTAAADTIAPTDHQDEGTMMAAEQETSVALPVDEVPVKNEATTGGSLGGMMMIVGEMITSEEGTLVGIAVTTGHTSTPEEIALGAQDQKVLGKSGVDHIQGRGGAAEALMIEEGVKVLCRDCLTWQEGSLL